MSSRAKTLRELLAEFEAVVSWFDGDDLDVEAAIAKFEEGSRLAEQIKKQLAAARNRVEIVKRNFAQGGANDPDLAADGDPVNNDPAQTALLVENGDGE